MSIKAVVFDLDGTLADTLKTIASAVNLGLAELGFAEHPEEAYRTMVGEGVLMLCLRALPEGHEDDLEPLLTAVRRFYQLNPLLHVRTYPGVAELVRALGERGAALGVLSNKPHELTVATVAGLELDARFGCVLGQRDDLPRKPDPGGALWILSQLGVRPAEGLLVGDTQIDVQTARAAGLISVAATWGFRTAEELQKEEPDYLVERPDQVLELYDRLSLPT